jgi:hypothetical protein
MREEDGAIAAPQDLDANSLYVDFLTNAPVRPQSPLQRWKSELDMYREISRPAPNTCPLQWWKIHAQHFPGLGLSPFFVSTIWPLSTCS